MLALWLCTRPSLVGRAKGRDQKKLEKANIHNVHLKQICITTDNTRDNVASALSVHIMWHIDWSFLENRRYERGDR